MLRFVTFAAIASHVAADGGCLCVFDVDRVLTGRQGETGKCPQNQNLPDYYDPGYGGGRLTLSDLGRHIDETFCGSCHLAAISAFHQPITGLVWRLRGGRYVTGCDDMCKVETARHLARQLDVELYNVWMFDDQARDDLYFKGTGMNAVQVSCASRDSDAGLCGAVRSEVRRIPGITLCKR